MGWTTVARNVFPLPFGRGEGQGEGIHGNMPIGRSFPLPTNFSVGRVTPCAPPPQSPKPGAHGVTRPTTKVRIPRNPFSRVESLNRSGGHPACRRAGASSPVEKASKQSTRRNGWPQVRVAGWPALYGRQDPFRYEVVRGEGLLRKTFVSLTKGTCILALSRTRRETIASHIA